MSLDPFRGMSRKQNLLMLAIFALAIFLRTFNIKEPDSLNFDEAHYVPAARILVGIVPHPGLADWQYIPTIHKSPDINFSHPPLGKYLIGLGMIALGDNSLGWRITASLFGVLGIIVFFVLANALFSNFRFAALACLFLCIDFMHIVQSRIGMLDIIMLFWFQLAMLGATLIVFHPQRLKTGILLAAVGIGIGIAVKVPVIAAALGALVSVILCTRYPLNDRFKISAIAAGGSLSIYGLWYFYYASRGYSFTEWLQFHYDVVRHVAGPLSQHRYGSHPGQWLLNAKPVWYYFKQIDAFRYGIIGLGNPIIWLLLIPSFGLVFGNAVLNRSTRDRFLVIWMLSSYLPLILMLWNRQGFLYHMFLALPVMILILVRACMLIRSKWPTVTVAAAAVIALVAFSPVILCLPMPDAWYLWITKMVGV
jgi:dolichyl-phosphate-mannose-protein mannosyltransferase